MGFFSGESLRLYYQTHLSPQACHLAPAAEGAIAAVSSSPLHIHPPDTSHWIQFILPEAFLSVLFFCHCVCLGGVHEFFFFFFPFSLFCSGFFFPSSFYTSSFCARARSCVRQPPKKKEKKEKGIGGGCLQTCLPWLPWEPGVCWGLLRSPTPTPSRREIQWR